MKVCTCEGLTSSHVSASITLRLKTFDRHRQKDEFQKMVKTQLFLCA